MAETSKNQVRLKLLLLGAALVLVEIALIFLPVPATLQQALLWVQSLGLLGAIAFILLYALATVLFVPGSVLTIGGGAVFGVLMGSVYVLLGATLGATLAFLVGRYFARDWVNREIEKHPKFRAIDQAVAKSGFKIVLLTRLSPIFPFSLLNYAFSATQVSLRDYVLGSIGMLPGTVLYVYTGSLTTAAINQTPNRSFQTSALEWGVRGIGLAATIAVTLYITRLAKKALEQIDQS
ncbi:MAG TPA: TVP38/TMEM64 family protein [Thermosynechococcaceae cyanobacterium]